MITTSKRQIFSMYLLDISFNIANIAHISRPLAEWLYLSLFVVPPAMVTSDQISTFSIYTGIKALY